MFKNYLTAMAFAALLVFVAGSAFAADITVDGLIADWETAGLLHDDPDDDHGGLVDVRRYGMTVIGDTFYAVMEMDRPVSDFDAGVIFPGSWINADQSAATELLNLPSTFVSGADINLEWGRGAAEGSGTDLDYSFWGKDDNSWKVVAGGVTGGMHADSGSAAMGVMEWSSPVYSIVTALAGLPDNVPSGFDWTVNLVVQGSLDGNTGWGYDFAGPVEVPEPGTLALLACGLMGLLCYAWRKRK